MKHSEQENLNEKCAHEVVQQERVICTVAADLLVMNKLLEEGKENSKTSKQQSTLKSKLIDLKTTIKKVFK